MDLNDFAIALVGRYDAKEIECSLRIFAACIAIKAAFEIRQARLEQEELS